MRNQSAEARLAEPWAQTSCPCPNFRIQPMSPAPGVTTPGEMEVLEFLQSLAMRFWSMVTFDPNSKRGRSRGRVRCPTSMPQTGLENSAAGSILMAAIARLNCLTLPCSVTILGAGSSNGCAPHDGIPFPGGEDFLLPQRYAELEHVGAERHPPWALNKRKTTLGLSPRRGQSPSDRQAARDRRSISAHSFL